MAIRRYNLPLQVPTPVDDSDVVNKLYADGLGGGGSLIFIEKITKVAPGTTFTFTLTGDNQTRKHYKLFPFVKNRCSEINFGTEG